ncbi:hypothetical protein D3C87_2001080 [compost metagenome]
MKSTRWDDASTLTSISGCRAEKRPMRGTSQDEANEGTVLMVRVRCAVWDSSSDIDSSIWSKARSRPG